MDKWSLSLASLYMLLTLQGSLARRFCGIAYFERAGCGAGDQTKATTGKEAESTAWDGTSLTAALLYLKTETLEIP